jgi:drug/metabolite transporter (DMT)-like permease
MKTRSVIGLAMILFFVPFETYPEKVDWTIWLAIAYLGICGSVLGFVWYYWRSYSVKNKKVSV